MNAHPYDTEVLDYQVIHYRMTSLHTVLQRCDMVLAEAGRGLEECIYAQEVRRVQTERRVQALAHGKGRESRIFLVIARGANGQFLLT